jgi:hypothetical protein
MLPSASFTVFNADANPSPQGEGVARSATGGAAAHRLQAQRRRPTRQIPLRAPSRCGEGRCHPALAASRRFRLSAGHSAFMS